MTIAPYNHARAATKICVLFGLFFVIACGLGYPTLNRYDPRSTPGLSDVRNYAALVAGNPTLDQGHVRFRVLVPWIARPFYKLAKGRAATWDPVRFGLLIANSLFVAATAVLIVILGARLKGFEIEGPALGLVGVLLYLVNFAVPNLRLVGLVDAGEGFFLLALFWSLSEFKLWLLPPLAVLGTLTKESFVPFSIVFAATWLLTVRSDRGRRLAAAIWIVISWVVSLGTMIFLQWSITGEFVSPMHFGLNLHRGQGYLGHLAASLGDRNLWYIFLWLLPTAIPNLKRFPKPWLIPTAATCLMAFALDAYFGGAPGTVGRALFTIAGPMLSLSSAALLLRIVDYRRPIDRM
jgi:hypothetical protein